VFAARHLRYEIYEKKQIQPLLSQRRRSRSTRSESEHSLTVSADARSPDTVGGLGSEAVSVGGEPVFVNAGTDEALALADPAVCPLHENALPAVDVSLCRLSASTVAALTHTSWIGTEAGHMDTGTDVTDVCEAISWPVRSFPLVDNDYDELQAAESVTVTSSASVPTGLTVSVASSLAALESDDTQWPSVTHSTTLR